MKTKLALVLLAILLLSACAPQTSPTPAGTLPPIPVTNQGPASNITEIRISGFSFDPSSLTVSVGTTVTWTNEDNVPHTIIGDNGEFSSPNLSQGSQFSFTFNSAGTYTYHCGVHPSMKATVIVQP